MEGALAWEWGSRFDSCPCSLFPVWPWLSWLSFSLCEMQPFYIYDLWYCVPSPKHSLIFLGTSTQVNIMSGLLAGKSILNNLILILSFRHDFKRKVKGTRRRSSCYNVPEVPICGFLCHSSSLWWQSRWVWALESDRQAQVWDFPLANSFLSLSFLICRNKSSIFSWDDCEDPVKGLSKELAQGECSVIPGTGEPGGLPSLGSHRVWHDWSDLAAAAAAARPRGEVSIAHPCGPC